MEEAEPPIREGAVEVVVQEEVEAVEAVEAEAVEAGVAGDRVGELHRGPRLPPPLPV